ncbi:serine--tRNA ligase [Mycoplasmopsis gallinarum]|uniref:Serine--tRNA ligase n=1 Tax=Mycoplasmopsis gallinarum TaxID=29557 RepID=A0A168RA14_9BACT|nr:serine--tRNA ligase [Mycoplasmopsis gallinarum]OAB48770.1 Seryl-tRNA synthetase [Mycoplasmopsis gallinarum]
MLNLKYLLENEDKAKKLLVAKKADMLLVDELFLIAKQRGKLMSETQLTKSLISNISKKIPQLKNNPEELEKTKNEVKEIKNKFLELEKQSNEYEKRVNFILDRLPNLPLDDVPYGKDENDNKVLKVHDQIGRGLVSGVKPHYKLALELDLIDIERAVKLSGSRFVMYKKTGAQLIRAIKNFLLDLHTKNGYDEYEIQSLVKPEILYGTGQLPKFEEDLFHLNKEDLYLIPTAEVPLTNIYNNEIINLDKPIRLTAFTECFRSEAGSGGKDTRGIIRLHQFKKVELVKITNEKDSFSEFEEMLEEAKLALEELELPYRELLLCTGDLGFSSRKTIDLEVWLPSEMKFREISSVSYMGDFQARRAKIRYKNENNENVYAYTMNGSGLAIDRLVAAILENYQNADGSLTIPKKLVPYMNGITEIK